MDDLCTVGRWLESCSIGCGGLWNKLFQREFFDTLLISSRNLHWYLRYSFVGVSLPLVLSVLIVFVQIFHFLFIL